MFSAIGLPGRSLLQTFVLIYSLLHQGHLLADESRYPVRVAEVKQTPISRVVSTYGVLSPKIEDLSFQINGRIAEFKVVEGQTVEEGEVLALLDKRDALDSLNKARVERDKAARQLERFETLSSEGVIQADQLENAKDTVSTSQIVFEQAELNLQRCTLLAPARGVILREYLDSRTTVSSGTPIFSFRDISKSWVTEVQLTDRNAFVFGLGTRATARFAPYPGEIFKGVLTKQAGVADENDSLYTVEVTILADGRELRPGMVVEIDLQHESDKVYTMVPLDALVNLRRNRGVIYLLEESSDKVEEQIVHIAAVTGKEVALIESISPGRSVVISGQQSLRDGARIRIL